MLKFQQKSNELAIHFAIKSDGFAMKLPMLPSLNQNYKKKTQSVKEQISLR